MRRAFVCYFLLIALLSSCSDAQKEDGSITFVNVNGNEVMVTTINEIKIKETIPLSDLIEDCELIRFDNKDEALFKVWWIYITMTDKHIGVRQEGDVYKLFDRSGKFLCNVGARGNGPGEYSTSIYDEIIDEESGKIYFSQYVGDKILMYDLNGKHIKDITLPYKLNKPKIALSGDGILTAVHMPFANDKAFAVQFDTDGNILYEMEPTESMRVQNFDGEIFSLRNTDAFDILHSSIDTLYHYDLQNNSLQPVFTSVHPQMTSDNGWFFQYKELPNYYLSNIYNYKTGQQLSTFSNKETWKSSQVHIVNDFYGGMEVPPNNFYKGYFIENLEPGELIGKIEKRLAEPGCTAADKKKLNELLSSLDENSNNLLFVGKLKQ